MKSACLSVLRNERDDDEGQLTEADQLTIEEDEDETTKEDDAGEHYNTDEMIALEHEEEVVRVDESKVMHKFLLANHADICLYLCLALLLISSCIAVVIVLLQIVVPYRRAHAYRTAKCTSVGVVHTPTPNTCMCGVGCTATYRCLIITVAIETASGNRGGHATHASTNATFYDNEATLGKQCSFYPPCRHSPSRAEDAVEEYEEEYGVLGKSFPCLYTPGGSVIRIRIVTLYHVLHGLIWSILVLIASVVGLVVTVKKKGCHCYTPEPAS